MSDIYPTDTDNYYKVRCDKHNLKPYVYCEMCMIRSNLQEIYDKTTQDTRKMLSETWLSIHVLNDYFNALQKQINEIKVELQLRKENE